MSQIENILKVIAFAAFGFSLSGFLSYNNLHLSTFNFAFMLITSGIGFLYVGYDYIVKDIWGFRKK